MKVCVVETQYASFSFHKFPLNNTPSLDNFAMQPLRSSAETPSISKKNNRQNKNKNYQLSKGMSFAAVLIYAVLADAVLGAATVVAVTNYVEHIENSQWLLEITTGSDEEGEGWCYL